MSDRAPQRKCIGCGKMHEKAGLLRVARVKSGKIFIDESQKSGGRGIYFCKNLECFAKAKKGRRLERRTSQSAARDLYPQVEEALDTGCLE